MPETLRPRRRCRMWLVVMAAAAVLHGCAGLGKRLEPPRISLTQITMESATVFEMVMAVTLRIFNSNDVPLTLKGADVGLELNGKDFARGISQIEMTLPAYDTALVPMTLYSSTIDMVKGVLEMESGKPLKYRVYGHVRIEGGFLMPATLPFSSTGELDLENLQRR